MVQLIPGVIALGAVGVFALGLAVGYILGRNSVYRELEARLRALHEAQPILTHTPKDDAQPIPEDDAQNCAVPRHLWDETHPDASDEIRLTQFGALSALTLPLILTCLFLWCIVVWAGTQIYGQL